MTAQRVMIGVPQGARRTATVVLSCTLLLAWAQHADAGTLDDAGDKTSGSGGGGSSSPSSGGSSRLSVDDGNIDLVLAAFYYIVLSPFSIPHAVADTMYPVTLAPAKVPFARPECGFYCGFPEDPDAPREKNPPAGSLLLDLDAGVTLQGIPNWGLGFDASLAYPALGIDTRLSLYREMDLGVPDYGLLGKSHINLRFATFPRVQFQAGVGVRYFAPPNEPTSSGKSGGLDHAALGFDFLYAVDIQWGRPVDTQLEFGLGNAGSAFVPEIRGTVGAYLGKFRLAAGWNQVWIGGEALGGPIINLGARF